MKVLIITANVSDKSGWGRSSRSIVEELVAQGVKVEIMSEQPPDKDITCVWHPLYPLSARFALWGFFQNIWTAHVAACKGIDVVHALDGWPFGVYGYAGVLGSKRKFFITGVGTYSVAPLYSRVRGLFLRIAYAHAHKIFCISEYVKKQLALAGINESKLVTVHLGATPLPEVSSDEINQLRQKYHIAPDRFPIVLTVGAIKDRKGQMHTLRAVELLKKKYPAILYIAVGSRLPPSYATGMEEYAVAHKLQDTLLIISGADDRVLSFFYSICSVFALNSTTYTHDHHFEGFGLVVVEGYQFGKPAVGSLNCGIEDAITDGITGLLARQKDPEDIANKISKVLDNIDFFSKNAKMRYTNFSWDTTVKTYIDFYTQ